MTMRIRGVLMLVAGLAVMGLASCGHYSCGTGFGSSTCTSTGSPSLGGGGTAGNAATAFAFAVDADGTIDGYTLSTGAGTFAVTTGYIGPTIPANTPGYGMVVAQGLYLYTLFPGTGQIDGFTISSTGSLTPVNGSPFDASYLIGSTVGGKQAMITNPAGTLLFVEDPSAQAVYTYQIGSGGVLTVAGLPLLLPFEPENMAIDGLGKYLYIGNVFAGSTTNEIAAYVIGNGTSLVAVSGSPFISPSSSFEYSMWQLQGDPSGQFMIGTTGSLTGDPHLYVFNIQQTGAAAGAITPVTGSPFLTATGFSPYAIAVQPSAGGDLVYSFSVDSSGTYNPIEGYQLNTSTGALAPVSGSPFTTLATGVWGQFDQSGKFLFVYDSALTQVAPLEVGSGGVLTQPILPVTTIDGFWTVSDPN